MSNNVQASSASVLGSGLPENGVPGHGHGDRQDFTWLMRRVGDGPEEWRQRQKDELDTGLSEKIQYIE